MSDTAAAEAGAATEARAAAILELDRDRNNFPSYYAAVLIRATAPEVRNTTEVRGTLSQILKGDYQATNEGRHQVFVRSDGTNQEGTVYTLARI